MAASSLASDEGLVLQRNGSLVIDAARPPAND